MPSSNEEELLDEMDSSDSDDEFPNTEKDETEEIEQKTEVPADISFPSNIVDISCHPKRNIVAAGLINGSIVLHTYGIGDVGNMELISFDHREKSCRAMCFSDSGEHLFTGFQDTVINVLDLETNSVFRHFARSSGSPLYSILPIDNYLLASGEDDGQVVLWDFRMQTPIQCFEDCEDYISCLVANKEKKILLATSGDGFLSAYNIRGNKLQMQSEAFNCDLLCAGIFKGGTKVAVGAGDGSLNIFNWGEYSNSCSKFTGHPGSVDAMVVVEDDIVCTGCEDGKVRAVQLLPNRIFGYLGNHGGYTVERVRLCYDKSLIASSSYDHKIKFWDLSGIKDLKSQDVKETKKVKLTQANRPLKSFFADLE